MELCRCCAHYVRVPIWHYFLLSASHVAVLRRYRPFFYPDELHVYRHDLVPLDALNASSSGVHVRLSFRPTSIGAHRLVMQLHASVALLQSQFGLSERDTEQVVMLFAPDNIYRLILTGNRRMTSPSVSRVCSRVADRRGVAAAHAVCVSGV